MSLGHCLILSAALFCLGLYGLFTRRHIIGMLMSIELLLNAALINFIAFAHFHAGDAAAGSIFSAFIIAVSSSEMAVALGIVVSLYKQEHRLDIESMDELHG